MYIRRSDAIEHAEVNGESHEFIRKMMDYLEDAETVEPCKDAISREYALGVIYPSNTYLSRADIYKALKDAPSVTVETKHGEWIFQECTDEIYGRAYECSICGVAVVGNHHHFCPNCGAKMKGADDEHDK